MTGQPSLLTPAACCSFHWSRQSLNRRAPARNSHCLPQVIGWKPSCSHLERTPIVELEAIGTIETEPWSPLDDEGDRDSAMGSQSRVRPPFAFGPKLFVIRRGEEWKCECRHFPDQPPILAHALRPQTRPQCSLKGEVIENSAGQPTYWCLTVPNMKSRAQRPGRDGDWLQIKLFILALSHRHGRNLKL